MEQGCRWKRLRVAATGASSTSVQRTDSGFSTGQTTAIQRAMRLKTSIVVKEAATHQAGALRKRATEERVDRVLRVRLQSPRARAAEMGMRDRRPGAHLLPHVAGPRAPVVFLLIEDKQRLITQLREFGAPPGTAADGVIRQDRADDVDFLAAVDLIPERLQDFADRGRVGVLAVHQLRHVREADIA